MLLMTILPWITLPMIGKKTVSRFLPGAIFMAVYVTLEGVLATTRKWWRFHINLKPNVLGEMPLILGPFFVGSLWIMKFTYRKFKLYLVINLIIDSIFTYVMIDWFKKLGYVSLVRINKFQLSLIFLIKSFVMYGFQLLYDKFLRNDKSLS